MELVKDLPQRDSYAVVASTSEGELGTTWVDDLFHDRIHNLMLDGVPLSKWTFGELSSGSYSQTPTMFLGFDTTP